MPRSRNWDALSSSYRARLGRAGITRESYLSGSPLRAARGHAATPEHPREAERRPERFREYLTRSQIRESQREAAKESTRAFIDAGAADESIFRYDIPDTERRIDAIGNGNILGLLTTLPDEERRDLARIGSVNGTEDERFEVAPPGIPVGTEWWVMIDGRYQNPFWYH